MCIRDSFIALKVKDFAGDVIHTFREFDKERRYARAVMGISDNEQKPLVDQAIHGLSLIHICEQGRRAQEGMAQRGVRARRRSPACSSVCDRRSLRVTFVHFAWFIVLFASVRKEGKFVTIADGWRSCLLYTSRCV